MTARPLWRILLRDTGGAGAAEFALLLPLSILFLVGLLDTGRLFYGINLGEKATQIGARWAVVTDPLAPELASESYVGFTTSGGTILTQGDRIPADALGVIECTEDGCICTPTPCPGGMGATRVAYADPAAFNALLSRMQQIMPQIEAANLIVEYRGSGLGYAGDPNGMDIAPLVTVRLEGIDFAPFILLGLDMTLPDFAYTLTMEDGAGTSSN
jgi:hypothetical protein